MSEHVVPIKTYLLVFLALMIGTAGTVWVSFHDLGWFPGANVAVALVIACTKATLVILFFMHVKYTNEKMTGAVVVAGFFFLAILLALSMSDYLTRAWR